MRYVSVFLVLLLSCHSKDPHQSAGCKPISVVKAINILTDTLILGLDSTSSFRSGLIQTFKEDSSTFLYVQEVNESIFSKYDLISGRCIQKIVLPEMGPNAPKGGVGNFFVSSKDTLWVLSKGNIIYAYSTKGELLERISYPPLEKMEIEPYAEDAIYKNSKFYVKNGYLVLAYYPSLSNETLEFYKQERILTYSLHTKEWKTLGSYPDIYKNKAVYFYLSEFCISPYQRQEVLTTDMATDEIQIFDFNGKKTSCFSAPSMYINREIPPLIQKEGDETSFQEQEDYMIRTPFYFWSLWDETTSLLFRWVKHSQPLLSGDGKRNHPIKGAQSIQVLDLQALSGSEFLLPEGVYDPVLSFVKDNTLFLYKSPEVDATLSENEAIFIGYRLE